MNDFSKRKKSNHKMIFLLVLDDTDFFKKLKYRMFSEDIFFRIYTTVSIKIGRYLSFEN